MTARADRPTKPDRALVRRKIARVFPGRNPGRILAVLDGYGCEPWERGRDRVQLAILKLCEERSLADPSPLVTAAKEDARGVLAAAEYPRQSAVPPGHPEMDASGQADLADYLAWLRCSEAPCQLAAQSGRDTAAPARRRRARCTD